MENWNFVYVSPTNALYCGTIYYCKELLVVNLKCVRFFNLVFIYTFEELYILKKGGGGEIYGELEYCPNFITLKICLSIIILKI